MRVALDSNVLVRYLAWDDENQARRAADLIEKADVVLISTMVLCEVVWVLRRAYKLGHAEVAAALRDLLISRDVETERPAAEAGLAALRRGGDFADGVILFEAERGKADRLATFDRAFAAGAASKTLLVLEP